jgi:hypothetical protein
MNDEKKSEMWFLGLTAVASAATGIIEAGLFANGSIAYLALSVIAAVAYGFLRTWKKTVDSKAAGGGYLPANAPPKQDYVANNAISIATKPPSMTTTRTDG